jgi:hypothetical protein
MWTDSMVREISDSLGVDAGSVVAPIMIEVTDEHRAKLKEYVSKGLISGGLGREPGSLCIESAICLAFGEPHGDRPSCVAQADRDLSIRLNDAAWPTAQDRADALLPIGLAQLGTAGTDRREWVKRVAEGVIRRVLPLAMRECLVTVKDPTLKAELEAAAALCEREGSVSSARAARDTWRRTAAYADADAASADADAADAAADAAAAYAAAAYAAYASAAYAAAAASADADASAASASAAYADALAARLRVLREMVSVVLDAYRAEGRA